MNKKILILASLFMIASANATQHIMDPKKVMKLPISTEGMTRISIEGDGIESLTVFPDDYKDNIQQEKSGIIYVVAEGLEEPLYVGLVTRRGIAQDLKLVPSQREAEPIVLKFETEETKAKEAQEEADKHLRSFVQGIIPAGFYVIKLDETSRGGGTLPAVVDAAYQNTHYRVVVYTIKNEGDEAVILDNRLFWDSRDLGAVFDHPQLEVDQTAKLYIIQKL